MKRILLITTLICLLIQPAFALEVAGVKLPENVEVGAEKLQLNGYGIRKKYFMKIYLGSLYTSQQVTSTRQVLASSGGKLIRMNFLYDKVEKARMVGGFAKGIENNSPELRNDPAVTTFLGWFDRDFVAGDQIDLAIGANDLVSASHNDRQLGALESVNLARALLLIYLGEEPADEDMKEGMLGDL